jgi:O-antigen ligase
MKLERFNQFLLAFYLGYLGISKYFISIFPEYSFLVLLVPTIVVVLLSCILNIRSSILKRYPLILMVGVILLILIYLAFSSTSASFTYSYYFLIYGAVPLFLLFRISKLDVFFKYFAYFGLAIVLLVGGDPLNDYLMTGDYMGYGYLVMLPAFAALFIGRKYYKMWWLLPLELVALILIILYANQGAILSAFSLILFSILLIDKPSRRQKFIYVMGIALAVLLVLQAKPVLEWGIDLAKTNGQSSYALEKAYKVLDGDADGLSGRSEHWDNALVMIAEKPVLGHGIGAFESKHGIYAHNLLLEITVSFGVVGLIMFLCYIAFYIRKMLISERKSRLSYVLGISIGVIPLMFSMQPFIWYFFWVFTMNLNIIAKPAVLEKDNDEK